MPSGRQAASVVKLRNSMPKARRLSVGTPSPVWARASAPPRPGRRLTGLQSRKEIEPARRLPSRSHDLLAFGGDRPNPSGSFLLRRLAPAGFWRLPALRHVPNHSGTSAAPTVELPVLTERATAHRVVQRHLAATAGAAELAARVRELLAKHGQFVIRIWIWRVRCVHGLTGRPAGCSAAQHPAARAGGRVPPSPVSGRRQRGTRTDCRGSTCPPAAARYRWFRRQT